MWRGNVYVVPSLSGGRLLVSDGVSHGTPLLVKGLAPRHVSAVGVLLFPDPQERCGSKDHPYGEVGSTSTWSSRRHWVSRTLYAKGLSWTGPRRDTEHRLSQEGRRPTHTPGPSHGRGGHGSVRGRKVLSGQENPDRSTEVYTPPRTDLCQEKTVGGGRRRDSRTTGKTRRRGRPSQWEESRARSWVSSVRGKIREQ